MYVSIAGRLPFVRAHRQTDRAEEEEEEERKDNRGREEERSLRGG